MSTPSESRAALQVVTSAAIDEATNLSRSVSGTSELRRAALLEAVPAVISYYADGAGALAADFYAEQRELAAVATAFTTQVVVPDRTVKIRRAVAWSTDPWFAPLAVTVESRLAEVVQLEVARAYRETIRRNRARDDSAVGWRRETAGGCKFCRMLADRGAVYKKTTARFAAHTSCHCTAVPVFGEGNVGPEASAMQYVASLSNRSEKQQAALRDYLDSFYA